MSKLKKVFIVIIVVFLLFCLYLGIRTIVNYKKLKTILDKQIEYIEKDNYSLKTVVKKGDEKTEIMAYYRQGVGKQVDENGVYTWTDGKDAYMIDEESKIVYVINMNKTSATLISSDRFAYLIPGYNDSFWDNLKLSGNLFNSIKTEKIGEEECYKITIQEEKYEKTVWITKNNYLPIKATMVFPSGEVFEYNYELKFSYTKPANTEMPDLNDYKVLDYETNKVIVEKFVTDETEENTISEENIISDI